MTSADDYAQRLLEEANRTLAPHRSGLEEALRGLRTHFLASLEQISPRIQSASFLELPIAGQIIAEAVREADSRAESEMTRIADFSRDLRKQDTQGDILTLLLEAARAFTPRAALFVLQAEHFVAWSSRGFSNKAAERLQGVLIESSASPAMQQARRTISVIAVDDSSDETVLSESLGQEAGLPWHLIPMKAMNRVVAVLLAAGTTDRSTGLNALRVLVELSALYIETLALRLLHEVEAVEILGVQPSYARVPATAAEAVPEAAAAGAVPPTEAPAPPPAQAEEAPAAFVAVPPLEPAPAPVAAEVEVQPEPIPDLSREEFSSPAAIPEAVMEPVSAPEPEAPALPEEPEPVPEEEAFVQPPLPETVPESAPAQVADFEIPAFSPAPVTEIGITVEEAFQEFAGEPSAEALEPSAAAVAEEIPVEVAPSEPSLEELELESPEIERLPEIVEEITAPAPEMAAIQKEILEPEVTIEPEAAAPPLPPEPAVVEPSVSVTESVAELPPSVPPAPAQPPAPVLIPESRPERTDAEIEIDNLLEAIGKPLPSAGKVEIDLSKEPPPTPIRITAPAPPPAAAERKPTEEEKMHADARRFARLLVSEIKLYNEQRLAEGRDKCDVYVRLKRDIDKSREMYEKRVPPVVSRKYDYFNDEVIRILAENDPAKMGSDYPGPRVES